MLNFIKNDHNTIVKCRLGSGGAVSLAIGSWQSFGGGSRDEVVKYWLFYIRITNKLLTAEETE